MCSSDLIQGRRYTDDATLEIVERVLGYETNDYLTGEIEKLGGRAMNLNFRTTNVLFGERLKLESDGEAIDLGHVGKVTRVDRTVIENLCYAGQVAVIRGRSDHGEDGYHRGSVALDHGDGLHAGLAGFRAQ